MSHSIQIQCLRSDDGGKYKANYYRSQCEDIGILQQFMAQNTLQQNGVLERDGKTPLGMQDVS